MAAVYDLKQQRERLGTLARQQARFRKETAGARAAQALVAKGREQRIARSMNLDSAISRARVKPNRGVNPFKLPQFPQAAMPPKDARMAMDDATQWAGSQWEAFGAVISSTYAEGLAFPGYAFLAELAQRPEYRKFAEILATEMTRKWIRFQSVGDNDKTQQIRELTDALDHFKVQAVFRKAIELDEFFGRSHIYVDTGDYDNREEERTSIGNGRDETSKAKIGRNTIKAFKPIEPVWCYPTRYDSIDPRRPDWYEPVTWFIMGWEVHKTRLLKFVGREVPDLLKPAYSFGGLSMSQMAQPYVSNWIRTRQSVSDLLHAFSVFVLQTNMGSSLNEGGDLLFKRVELFNMLRDNRGLMMCDKETEVLSNVSAPLGGLDSLQAQAQEQMAAVSSIPLVKLLGIQPAGLNASSDGEIRVFYDHVHASQEARMRPNLTTVIDFIQLSLWGQVDDDITFEFEPLMALTEKEKAEVSEIESRMDSAYIDSGVLHPAEARKSLAADPDSRYSSIEVDDVPELRAEEEQGLVPEGGGKVAAELAGGEAEQQQEVPQGAVEKEGKDSDGDDLSPFQRRVAKRGERHARREGEFYERADARTGEGRLDPDYLKKKIASPRSDEDAT
jgi:phage-related protein (TIGR01555 family)